MGIVIIGPIVIIRAVVIALLALDNQIDNPIEEGRR